MSSFYGTYLRQPKHPTVSSHNVDKDMWGNGREVLTPPYMTLMADTVGCYCKQHNTALPWLPVLKPNHQGL